VLKTVLDKISQLKEPIKCLLKTSRNPWTNICFRFIFWPHKGICNKSWNITCHIRILL